MKHVCKNCEFTFDGAYCGNCGQRFDVPQFTFSHIFEESFHAFTHADKSFLTFLKKLIIHPGNLAREYIVERKRKRYFNPFTFFLLITAINAFFDGFELNLKEKLFHVNNEYGHIFNVYSKILSLVSIPVIALALWLLNAKRFRPRYSEYTVFAMILLSLASLLEIFVHVINYFFTAVFHKDINIENNVISLVVGIAYIAYANYNFHLKIYRDKLWARSLAIGISFFLVQVAVQIFIIWGIINGFQGIGNFYVYGIKFH